MGLECIDVENHRMEAPVEQILSYTVKLRPTKKNPASLKKLCIHVYSNRGEIEGQEKTQSYC